jgi:hypothetical protein
MKSPKLITSAVGSPLHDLPSLSAREGRGEARRIAIHQIITMAITLFTATRIADMLLPCLPCNAIFCLHGAVRGVCIMSDLPDESASVCYKQNAGEVPPPSVLYPLWKMSSV